MESLEQIWARPIIESKNPVVGLEKHLQFLVETPDCTKLLHYLLQFVDDVALVTSRPPKNPQAMPTEVESPRFYAPDHNPVLRVRMFAGKKELLIGAPDPNSKSDFPSLEKIWKHARRLEINTTEGDNAIVLLSEHDDDPWYEASPLEGEDDEIVERFAEWGPAPISNSSYGASVGPFYVYDNSGPTGFAGEPALRKVSRPSWDSDFRDFGQRGTDLVVSEQLNLNFGIGGIFLRVWARELLSGHIKLEDTFTSFEAFLTKVQEIGP
ncbi:hypothetical protein [Leptospira weilii]|nr:hypothetical protein [Leptospira weilii]